MKTFVGLILLAALGVTITYTRRPSPTMEIGTKVGQAYPNYIFPSLEDGRPVALSQFRGKKIILHHFASW